MRTSVLSLGNLMVLCLCGALSPSVAVAQSARADIEKPLTLSSKNKSFDPSSVFLEVYQLTSAAERLIKTGDNKAAMTALTRAESYLALLQKERPEWQPNVVRYRRELNARTLETVRKKVQEEEARNPSRKPDFLDKAILPSNPGRERPGGMTLPGRMTDVSAGERALQNRLREVLEDLNKTRARAEMAEDQLKKISARNSQDAKRLADLEAELQLLKKVSKSDREKELEAQLAEARKAKDETSSEREKKLEDQLAEARRNSSIARSSREEELLRQIQTLTQVARDKTSRELELERELRTLRAEMLNKKTKRELELENLLDDTSSKLTAALKRAEAAERGTGGGGSGAAYDALNQEYMRSQIELKAVTKALRDSRIAYEELMERTVNAESGEKAYKSQLDKLRKRVRDDQKTSNSVLASLNKQIAQLEKRVKDSETEKALANAEMQKISQRMQETEAQLADVSSQRDSLKTERDQMSDLLKINNPGSVKNLMDQNLDLARQLRDAQDKLAVLESSNTSQESQLKAVKVELAFVKQRMIELRDENTDYRKRISQLSEKLRVADGELEKVINQPKADPQLIEENRLLRDAISKQLRILASREKSRELLKAAYTRLKIKDPQMANAIELLNDNENLTLTEEEKKIVSRNPGAAAQRTDAVFVAPGTPTAEESAKAYMNLQMEVDALGKGAFDAYNKGRYAASEQLYQTLLEKHPGHYAAHINLGVILLKLNRVEEAQKILQNAVDLDPDHPTGEFLLGVALYRQGRDAAAQQALTLATIQDPANARAFIYLGNIASSALKTEAAIKNYQKALEIDPKLVDVYYNMATTYMKAGKMDEARKCYDLSIRAGALPDLKLEKELKLTSPPRPEASEPSNKAEEKKEEAKPAAEAEHKPSAEEKGEKENAPEKK